MGEDSLMTRCLSLRRYRLIHHTALASLFAASALVSVTITFPARADDGDWVLSAERLMGLYLDQPSTSGQATGSQDITETTTNQTVHFGFFGNQGGTVSSIPRLALDHFLSDQLSVGGSFVFASQSRTQTQKSDNAGAVTESEQNLGSTRTLLVHPRVGLAFPFGDTWGLWARGGVQIGFVTDQRRVVDEFDPSLESVVSTDTFTVSAALDGMFWFSPVKNVAFLGGPYLDLGLLGSFSPEVGDGSDARQTSFGLALGLAVYL